MVSRCFAGICAMDHDRYSDAYLKGILDDVRTIAVVGASANRIRPSWFVMSYMSGKGFRVIPVNPALTGQALFGETAYATLTDIPGPVDMVDIFRGSDAAGAVVDEALALNPLPKAIWMQFAVRNDEAATRAEACGVRVVMDRCPKVEWARLNGELGWLGVNAGIISSKKRRIER